MHHSAVYNTIKMQAIFSKRFRVLINYYCDYLVHEHIKNNKTNIVVFVHVQIKPKCITRYYNIHTHWTDRAEEYVQDLSKVSY